MSCHSEPRQHHPARRADIQSLRALAIALVVAAHAHLSGFQGGFVGVDVFFVLSGFLISGLILTEVKSTGHFRAFAFYTRRLKRLLPALLFVLLSVAAITWMVAISGEHHDASAGRAATLWLSNFYFAARVINYFAADHGPNLFLHTWSLAVEEQFYLVWPWLVIFLYGIWRWQGRPMSHKRLAVGLVLTAAASLAIGVYWADTDLEAGFYLMPGRIWEFALGALTFMLVEHLESGFLAWLDRLRGRSIFNVLGWLVILTASTVYTTHLRYPGAWALLPCMGAALVLLDAPQRRPSSIVSAIMLRQRGIQWVGDISYSLYLWHWPVLILGSRLLGDSVLDRSALVMLGLALSAFTFSMIENPIRRLKLSNPAKILAPSLLAMAIGYIAMGVWHDAAVNMLHTPAQKRIIVARLDLPVIYDNTKCDTWFHSAQVVACRFGPQHAAHTAAMFGDSILAQWFPAVAKVYLKKPDWNLVVLTKSACPASEIDYFYDKIKRQYKVCDIWRRHAIKALVRLHPDTVIMGSSDYRFTARQWIAGTKATLDSLSPAAGEVVVMSPTPELGFNGPDCLSIRAERPDWLRSSTRCVRRIQTGHGYAIYSLLKVAARPFRNVHVIDMRRAVCPHNICRAQFDSTIAYRDKRHLTASFIDSLEPALRARLRSTGVLQ